MSQPDAGDFPKIRSLIKARLAEQVESDRDKEGEQESPQFRYAIDGTGTDYPLGPPSVINHEDGDGVVTLYEFPIIESDRKLITALVDGNELLMRQIPPVGVIEAYVDFYVGDVIGQDDSGFVLFYNDHLGYWQLAEAHLRDTAYDTKARGFWGKDR